MTPVGPPKRVVPTPRMGVDRARALYRSAVFCVVLYVHASIGA